MADNAVCLLIQAALVETTGHACSYPEFVADCVLEEVSLWWWPLPLWGLHGLLNSHKLHVGGDGGCGTGVQVPPAGTCGGVGWLHVRVHQREAARAVWHLQRVATFEACSAQATRKEHGRRRV